jgi:signal transduction histidine kinase
VNPQGYALLGLTALVAALVSIVVFAVLRFGAAARDSRRVLRDESGQSPLLAAALQDAIQKLRAQEKATAERAEASERLNTQIISSLTAGLLVVNHGGDLQILNPAGRKMLGIADFTGSRLADLPPAAAPLAAAINECLTTGQPIVRRALEMPHAGAVTHVGVTVSPLGANGNSSPSEALAQTASLVAASSGPLRGHAVLTGENLNHLSAIQPVTPASGVICLFSDLTAVVELEEQLRLKETLARLGELTAGIAHEFRNGLATIHGYGKLLDPGALPPQFRPYVEGIRQETVAMGQVVTNFLNFARPAQLSLATYDLGTIIERAVDDVKPEAKQLHGDIVVSGDFAQVEADDVLLRQAFMNLLRNAIEACQGHGVAPDVRVEGTIDQAQAVARVTVHDNGPGVDADAREKVFRPFFTTKKDGTGLGLALVQKIIVTHNGRVNVANGPNGGASFQVTLPIT